MKGENQMIKKNIFFACLMMLPLAGIAHAQDAEHASGNHAHRAPSQAAIDACSGKSEGDACTYTNPKGEEKSGACTTTDEQLFCKRNRKS